MFPPHLVRRCLLSFVLLAGCAQLGLTARSDLSTYRGTLPCVDCDGRNSTLTLLDDGTYRMRMVEDGKPHAQPTYELGRWQRHDGRLDLSVGWRFVERSDGALNLLDSEGQPIAYSLKATRPDRIAGPMPLSGMYVYQDHAASLILCATGTQVPVLLEGGDATALQHAYLDAHVSETPVLIDVIGRFIERAPEPGAAKREFVRVEKFVRLEPDDGCPNRFGTAKSG